MKKYIFYIFCLAMGVSSCSTSKQATKDTTAVVTEQKKQEIKLPENINADADVEIMLGDNDVSAPGELHMRRDKCIRLQLFVPLLGTEVGRLEFTPDYVLVIDRMHKQYAKESYDKISSLSSESIDFKKLQALFWDDTNETTITLSKSGVGSLIWNYGGFEKVETKAFPCEQTISINPKGNKSGKITIKLSDLNTKSDWELETTISSKYKKIETNDILKMLGN